MGWNELLSAWKLSRDWHTLRAPASESQLEAAEKQLGLPLPVPLCELYGTTEKQLRDLKGREVERLVC